MLDFSSGKDWTQNLSYADVLIPLAKYCENHHFIGSRYWKPTGEDISYKGFKLPSLSDEMLKDQKTIVCFLTAAFLLGVKYEQNSKVLH